MLEFAASKLGLQMIAAALFAIAVASFYGAWHHKVYTEGGAATAKVLQPKIDGLDAALKTAETVNGQYAKALSDLRAAFAEQGKAVDKLKQDEADAQAASRAAIASAVASSKFFTGEVARLKAIAANPSTDKGQDCENVDALLRGIAGDRMRDDAGR